MSQVPSPRALETATAQAAVDPHVTNFTSNFLEPCTVAAARGAALGALAGGGFHIATGYALRASGRTNVQHATICTCSRAGDGLYEDNPATESRAPPPFFLSHPRLFSRACAFFAGREASLAVIRFGGVLSLFAALRCGVDTALHGSPPPFARAVPPGTDAPRLLPSLVAGAVSVSLPTMLIPERQEHLRALFSKLLKRDRKAVGAGLIFAHAATSGAVVFGGADYLLRRAGFNWS